MANEKIRKRVILAAIALAVVAGLAWGINNWRYNRKHQSTDDAQVDGRIVPVLARVGGYVTSVRAEENKPVKAGAVLATLDDAEYRARLAQAEADLAAAQATAGGEGMSGQAQSQVFVASGQRSALDAQILAARANSERAQADLARARGLAAKQIISRQQLDAAQAAAAAARAAVTAAQSQAAAAGATVSTARAGVRVAEAKLQSARAARDNARLQLDYTRITAPESGLVARRQVEVGQLVAPGQPLLSIVSDSTTWVTANFKETQLGRIRVGEPVEFTVDAYGSCVAAGRVESVSGATGARFALLPPDNATGNFTKVVQRVPVRIAVTRGCAGDRPLRPGMSVNVHVATAER